MKFEEIQKIACSILCIWGIVAIWSAVADGLCFMGVPIETNFKCGMAGVFAVIAGILPYVKRANAN